MPSSHEITLATDGVLFLRCVHADRQTHPRCESHFCKSTVLECCHRFDSGLARLAISIRSMIAPSSTLTLRYEMPLSKVWWTALVCKWPRGLSRPSVNIIHSAVRLT